jgi:hypothetical protein
LQSLKFEPLDAVVDQRSKCRFMTKGLSLYQNSRATLRPRNQTFIVDPLFDETYRGEKQSEKQSDKQSVRSSTSQKPRFVTPSCGGKSKDQKRIQS